MNIFYVKVCNFQVGDWEHGEDELVVQSKLEFEASSKQRRLNYFMRILPLEAHERRSIWEYSNYSSVRFFAM